MTEITLKIYQISTYIDQEKTKVRLFCRSDNNKKICLEDVGFDYFFINISTIDPGAVLTHLKQYNKDESKIRIDRVNAEIQDVPGDFLKIYTPSVKITEELVKELKQIHGCECYEHDVSFEKKYLLEKQIFLNTTYVAEFNERKLAVNSEISGDLISLKEGTSKIEPKILYFDIETYDDGRGINYDANPILMISLYGDVEKVLVSQKYTSKIQYVEQYNNEKELLIAFEKYIKEYNPDILCGYNIKGFDIPYILRRAEILNCTVSFGATHIQQLKNKQKFFAEGVLLFDIYQLLKNILRSSIPDGVLTLKNVSKTILKETKKEVVISDLSKIWSDPDKTQEIDIYAEYCLIDSKLCEQLFNYFKYDIWEFAHMINVNIEELAHVSFSQIVEFYLIQRSREFNQIIPNKPETDIINIRSEMRFQGAFVFDPKPGLYENIAVFDFRSLYPSIIESHNITKGRLLMKKVENCFSVPGKPYFFAKEPKAFIPTLTEHIISRRGRLKELLKTAPEEEKPILISRIGTLKVIANSLYGYLGFYMARWYSFECAESVTAFGRHYIKKVIDLFNEKGLTVIYSDTDSIFILLGNRVVRDATQLAEEINETLPGLMNLELENTYIRGIFVEQRGSQRGAKKRYALLDQKGNLKVAGMAMVRGDWSPVAKKMQRSVLETLLSTKNAMNAREKVITEIDSLEKRPLADFIIKTKLTKNIQDYETKGPHVAAAMRMKDRGEYVRGGSVISYIVIKGDSTKIGDRARLPDEVDIKEIDFEYYVENQILPSLEGIFEVFKVNISDIKKKGDQKALSSFFK